MERRSSDARSLAVEAQRSCGRGSCEQAIAALEELLTQQPSNYEVQLHLGVCYSGGCRRHSLTDSDIAMAYLHQALNLMGDSAPAAVLAKAFDYLGNSYAASRKLPASTRLVKAIECERQAAALYRSCGEMDACAREEYNIGNMLCELPVAEHPAKWREAISYYEAALAIRTRERDPVRYAATVQNLGAAYRELPGDDRPANIARAIQCYRRALRVYKVEKYPSQNAALHNNLGNAYLSFPATGDRIAARNARRALRHLDRALLYRTARKYPRDYGITQYSRGHAFLQLAAAGESRALPLAERCFQEAEQRFLECGAREYLEMVERSWKLLHRRAPIDTI